MPRFIQRLYPERVWAFSNKKDSVYLTFDDGPIPEVTPWVLDELKKHNAKATFFCIGENAKKHPEIFQRIIAESHAIGNHTFNHLNGWKTETSEYIENTLLAEKLITSKLFRPPYGKITSKQAKQLQQKGFKIIMWDVLSYDFDATISEKKCLQSVLKNIKPGSIVVFHDSLKAEKNLRYVLPKVLEYLKEKNLSPVAFDSRS
ncbi:MULTISPECIES: polysaccharide deacetylase family protein [Aequorivita]|uniref:Polysaccharide deacetylase family protein n=1 Tax=Aequorivita iocasae TaxID=2803865 RepID=A0ABX7DV12_9FLAO|nr:MULTISPECIES: polysaccharide deacetylase family protein [Aequorivita]QQX77849.1 polysaccharide deacetylase family protein [Aequorivita iocasae]UCA57349.1 polysaccharide deacetylase family protein [Aequorivita sp. F7]